MRENLYAEGEGRKGGEVSPSYEAGEADLDRGEGENGEKKKLIPRKKIAV